MRLEELLKMTGAAAERSEKAARQGHNRTPTTNGPGRGRSNSSTGHRGISKRGPNNRNKSKPYQVFTLQTPARYIGCAETLEDALHMQASFVDENPPERCDHIKGVTWAGHGYRANLVIGSSQYRKRGFKTPEDAAQWIEEKKVEHAYSTRK